MHKHKMQYQLCWRAHLWTALAEVSWFLVKTWNWEMLVVGGKEKHMTEKCHAPPPILFTSEDILHPENGNTCSPSKKLGSKHYSKPRRIVNMLQAKFKRGHNTLHFLVRSSADQSLQLSDKSNQYKSHLVPWESYYAKL